MIQEKDGLWFSLDYCKLNAMMLIPYQQINSTLAGSTLFTTLNLAFGCWQVE